MINELLKLAKKYKNVVVLNTGVYNDSRFDDLKKFFPDRCFSFGLAEGNMISAAAGFALMGKMPIVVGNGVRIFSNAYSQINEEVCSMNLNVKIVDVESGIDSSEDIKLVCGLTNMNVLDSTDETEIDDLLEKLVLNYGPMYLKL